MNTNATHRTVCNCVGSGRLKLYMHLLHRCLPLNFNQLMGNSKPVSWKKVSYSYYWKLKAFFRLAWLTLAAADADLKKCGSRFKHLLNIFFPFHVKVCLEKAAKKEIGIVVSQAAKKSQIENITSRTGKKYSNLLLRKKNIYIWGQTTPEEDTRHEWIILHAPWVLADSEILFFQSCWPTRDHIGRSTGISNPAWHLPQVVPRVDQTTGSVPTTSLLWPIANPASTQSQQPV